MPPYFAARLSYPERVRRTPCTCAPPLPHSSAPACCHAGLFTQHPPVHAPAHAHPQPPSHPPPPQVTPWNVDKLREAVIAGPGRNPGAVAVEDERGRVIMLRRDKAVRGWADARGKARGGILRGKQMAAACHRTHPPLLLPPSRARRWPRPSTSLLAPPWAVARAARAWARQAPSARSPPRLPTRPPRSLAAARRAPVLVLVCVCVRARACGLLLAPCLPPPAARSPPLAWRAPPP